MKYGKCVNRVNPYFSHRLICLILRRPLPYLQGYSMLVEIETDSLYWCWDISKNYDIQTLFLVHTFGEKIDIKILILFCKPQIPCLTMVNGSYEYYVHISCYGLYVILFQYIIYAFINYVCVVVIRLTIPVKTRLH